MKPTEEPIAGLTGSTHLEQVMPTNTKKESLRLSAQAWNKLIEKNREALLQNISEVELSALHSWVADCFQGFNEIYFKLLGEIKNFAVDDSDSMHDKVVDVYWKLDHIKNHIIAADKGFFALMNLLAKKAEEKEGKG